MISDQLAEAADVADFYRKGQEFVKSFYRRHPKLRNIKPRVNATSESGGGSHPEARMKGDKIYLFEKFWDLDQGAQDFVFAHELGHYAARKAKIPDLAKDLGVDIWSSLPFSQHNYEEAFADAFATYHLDRRELARRYPRWLSLVEVVLGKKKSKGQPMDELTRYAKRAYQNAMKMADTAEERAELTAITVGRQAKRMGFDFQSVSMWLQSAYGNVWVKGGNLNPGMDLKDILEIIKKVMK
jgi:hypothetical protein